MKTYLKQLPNYTEAGKRILGSRIISMLGILLSIMAVLLYIKSDAFSGLLRPPCTLNTLTGLQCPVCGGTRAAQFLLEGNLKMAWRYNPLVVSLVPVLAYAWGYLFMLFARRRSLYSIDVAPFWIWFLFVATILFGIIRNIPHPLLEPLRVPVLF